MTGPCFSVEQFSGSAVSILSWDYDVDITSAYLQRMLPGDTAVKSEAVASCEAGPMADPCIA